MYCTAATPAPCTASAVLPASFGGQITPPQPNSCLVAESYLLPWQVQSGAFLPSAILAAFDRIGPPQTGHGGLVCAAGGGAPWEFDAM